MNKAREQKIIVELVQRLHYNIFGCYVTVEPENVLSELYSQLTLLCDSKKSRSGKRTKVEYIREYAENQLHWGLSYLFDPAFGLKINLNTIADLYINYKIQSDPRYEYRTHPYPKRQEFLDLQESASCVYREIKAEITQATRKPSRGSSGNF